jgi:hypothetical protein
MIRINETRRRGRPTGLAPLFVEDCVRCDATGLLAKTRGGHVTDEQVGYWTATWSEFGVPRKRLHGRCGSHVARVDGQNRVRDQRHSPVAAPCRLYDENSRGKVQNVRETAPKNPEPAIATRGDEGRRARRTASTAGCRQAEFQFRKALVARGRRPVAPRP